MRHIKIAVLLVAIVLSLACGGINIAGLGATPTPVAQQIPQPAYTPAPASSPIVTYAPIQKSTVSASPAVLPTLAALATLQAQPSPSTRPATAAPTSGVPPTLVRAVQPTLTPAPVSIPSNWKVSKDSTGSCQVSTPPTWVLGKDFFFALEQAATSPIQNSSGYFPPRGAALWASNESISQGTRYQVRTSLVIGDKVCSVWRIKSETDFTGAEKSEMALVGKTLKGALR